MKFSTCPVCRIFGNFLQIRNFALSSSDEFVQEIPNILHTNILHTGQVEHFTFGPVFTNPVDPHMSTLTKSSSMSLSLSIVIYKKATGAEVFNNTIFTCFAFSSTGEGDGDGMMDDGTSFLKIGTKFSLIFLE